jgi:hypothetical protein
MALIKASVDSGEAGNESFDGDAVKLGNAESRRSYRIRIPSLLIAVLVLVVGCGPAEQGGDWAADPVWCEESGAVSTLTTDYQGAPNATFDLPEPGDCHAALTSGSPSAPTPAGSLTRIWQFSPDWRHVVTERRDKERDVVVMEVSTPGVGTRECAGLGGAMTGFQRNVGAYFLADGRIVLSDPDTGDSYTTDTLCETYARSERQPHIVDTTKVPEGQTGGVYSVREWLADSGWLTEPVDVKTPRSAGGSWTWGPQDGFWSVMPDGTALTLDPLNTPKSKIQTDARTGPLTGFKCAVTGPREWACPGIQSPVPGRPGSNRELYRVRFSDDFREIASIDLLAKMDRPITIGALYDPTGFVVFGTASGLWSLPLDRAEKPTLINRDLLDSSSLLPAWTWIKPAHSGQLE